MPCRSADLETTRHSIVVPVFISWEYGIHRLNMAEIKPDGIDAVPRVSGEILRVSLFLKEEATGT